MSQFSDQYAALAVPRLLDRFGDDVTWTSSAGAATVTASVGEEMFEPDGRMRRATREFKFSRTAIANISRTDSLAFGGNTYYVEEVLSQSASMGRVKAGRLDTRELTDVIHIERATFNKSTAGDTPAGFVLWKANVACLIEPISAEPGLEHEVRYTQARYTVYIVVDSEITGECRLRDNAGTYYSIAGIATPEFRSQAMQLDVEVTPFPLAVK